MKKLMIFGLLVSLFAFWGSKNEVNKVCAEEVVPHAGTSATFSSTQLSRYFTDLMYQIHDYNYNAIDISKIKSIRITNNPNDSYDSLGYLAVCDPVDVSDPTCSNNAISLYVTEDLGASMPDDKWYDCVFYSNVDTIYANMDSSNMFSDFPALGTLDISILDTSKVWNMNSMFNNCSLITSLDVSNFNTSSAIDMGNMFNNCSLITSLDVSNFNTSNVTNMENMFYYCSSLTSLDVSNFNTSNVNNIRGMFSGCSSLTSLDVSNFNTSNVTNMENMFNYCSSLTSLDVSNFNTSNVNNIYGMFSECSSLTSLDVSNFNTSNVNNINEMFSGCSSLTELNVSNFDTTNVIDMYSMFRGCSSLTKLDVSNFDTSNVTSINNMFSSCSSLKRLNLSSFDLKHIGVYEATYEMLHDCPNLEYFKSPKALPDDSTTNSRHVINLPSQFAEYYGTTSLTNENLSQYPVFNIPGEKFIRDWQTLRTEGGENEICAALTKGTESNAKLTQLLADYKKFDAETKEYVDVAIDKEDVTIGKSVEYFQNVVDGKQATNGNYNGIKDDTGSFMTISLTEESPYLIVLISLIGILSVLGYYFYNKKKQAM